MPASFKRFSQLNKIFSLISDTCNCTDGIVSFIKIDLPPLAAQGSQTTSGFSDIGISFNKEASACEFIS